VEGQHVDGGYAINLRVNRHYRGRTYGRSPVAARVRVNTAVAAQTTDDDKRTAAIDVLKEELASDVQKMRDVANEPDDHPKLDFGHLQPERRVTILRHDRAVCASGPPL